MTLRRQPVRVATSSEDSDGQFVFADGFLVAVLGSSQGSTVRTQVCGSWRPGSA
jgi:hypothetical protein